MPARTGSRFDHGTVVAYMALFVALGGSAYAVTSLPRNSVGTKQLKNGAVTTKKIKNGAVTAAKVNARGLTAPNAKHATTAGNAGNADKLDNKDSTAFALAGSEVWKTPQLNSGNFGSNPFIFCSWSNFGSPYNDAGFFRDPAGVVHLKGLVLAKDNVDSCGDTASGRDASPDLVIFTLPAGYLPDHRWAFATVSHNAPGRINVNQDGTVAIENGFPSWTDAKAWVSLDGLTFRCAPPGQSGCP